ncbi:transposase [Arthrobacter sp. NPDC080073]|uniref:transposase n=1 Tax=Arthrobacter sp. NPDC080073 TaxID=3155919 RepID=UPI003425A7E4
MRLEEALRDLSRLRAGAAKDLAHARQHVNAVLLRHGIRYPKDNRWTKEHSLWLHRQRFEEPALQFTYEADLVQAELLAGHLARIDKHVAATAAACRYSPVVEALMCLRGIQMTTAFGLAVEIGDWTRFTGSSIGSYLGLVPSENSSGQSRHQGRKHLRPQTPHRTVAGRPAMVSDFAILMGRSLILSEDQLHQTSARPRFAVGTELGVSSARRPVGLQGPVR